MNKVDLKAFDIETYDIEIEFSKKIAPIHKKIEKIEKNHEMKSLKVHKDFLSKEKKSQEKMDEIIEEVKDFAKDYAKKNGFSYILGSNESGNVLYGDSQYDLTETLTDAINNQYKEDNKSIDEEKPTEVEESKSETTETVEDTK